MGRIQGGNSSPMIGEFFPKAHGCPPPPDKLCPWCGSHMALGKTVSILPLKTQWELEAVYRTKDERMSTVVKWGLSGGGWRLRLKRL